MLILIASLLPLLIGPLIVDRALRERRLRDVVDGFIFVSIAGLVLLDILPHLIGHLGWAALLLVALGYWGPSFVEQRFRAERYGKRGIAHRGLTTGTLYRIARIETVDFTIESEPAAEAGSERDTPTQTSLL